MHLQMSLQQLLIILVIVVLIFGGRHMRGLRRNADQLARELSDAVQRRMPVYSAETTRGKEAEFIRDRLPKRFPMAIFIALLVISAGAAGAAWWLTH
jgi:Sec-independent protein translocase protein TatA